MALGWGIWEGKVASTRLDLRCCSGLRPGKVVYYAGRPFKLLFKADTGPTEWWVYELAGLELLRFKATELVTHLRACWTLSETRERLARWVGRRP